MLYDTMPFAGSRPRLVLVLLLALAWAQLSACLHEATHSTSGEPACHACIALGSLDASVAPAALDTPPPGERCGLAPRAFRPAARDERRFYAARAPPAHFLST
jgi:hypothetical protein